MNEKFSFLMLLKKTILMMTPSCKVISRKISESFDRKLTVFEKIGIKLHVWACYLCDRYRQQMLAIHDAVIQYAENAEGLCDKHLSESAQQRILYIVQKSITD